MPKSSPEKREYMLSYYRRNRARILAYNKERGRVKYVENPEVLLAKARKSNVQLKLEVLSQYGPNKHLMCAWPDCTVTDIDMLSLDHINDNGAEHRRQYAPGYGVYRELRREGYPEGYQTLCHNHNWKKEILRRRG